MNAKRKTPDWLLTTLWFAAGVLGGGAFWFFLSSRSPLGATLSALGTAFVVCVAVALQVNNDRLRKWTGASIPVALLDVVWSYPEAKGQESWAVKESAILAGQLGAARDEPGLGVAIVTTELALAAFGQEAVGRIEKCADWGLRRTNPKTHWVVSSVRDHATWRVIEEKDDLRHTLALGVILSRTHSRMDRLEEYVRLAVALQEGRLPAGPTERPGRHDPVFTQLYGIELLHVAGGDRQIDHELANAALRCRDLGIRWLMENRRSDGLWTSGALADVWEPSVATAWVLHRLVQTADSPVPGWRRCLEEAGRTVIQGVVGGGGAGDALRAADAQTRQRVQARIAAGIHRLLRLNASNHELAREGKSYLAGWRDEVLRWAGTVNAADLDVATAAFIVDALAEEGDLAKWGRMVMGARRREGGAV